MIPTRPLATVLRNTAALLLAHWLGSSTRRRWPVALGGALLWAAWVVLDFSHFAQEKHTDDI